MSSRHRLAAAALAAVLTQSAPALAAAEKSLYGFTGNADGAWPTAGLVADSSGALYGTTTRGGNFSVNGYGGGVVFKLTPPGAGRTAWTRETLYAFVGSADGIFPTNGNLVLGKGGVIYGTTSGRNGIECETETKVYSCDTVYSLTPPAKAGGRWAHKVLFYFNDGSTGQDPEGGLELDRNGALYGTTMGGGRPSGCSSSFSNTAGDNGCGIAYRLNPPTKARPAWSETVLHYFTGGADGGNPATALTPDPKESGAFYGTAATGGSASCFFGSANCGVVFKLTPPSSGHPAWRETVVHSFASFEDGIVPMGALLASGTGVLYGTAADGGESCDIYGCGTVFELEPVGASWKFTALHVFKAAKDGGNPMAGLQANAAGALLGTTQARGTTTGCDDGVGCGVVFELSPPTRNGSRTESVLYRFAGRRDGGTPLGSVLVRAGTLYGTTITGGDANCQGPNESSGCGVVFELTP